MSGLILTTLLAVLSLPPTTTGLFLLMPREMNPPPSVGGKVQIIMAGSDFQWQITYPGRDGLLGTADDRLGHKDLHLPAGVAVHLALRSHDYIYTLAFPHLNLKQMAIPELDFSLEFETGAVGTHPLLGDQMCGYAHEGLLGKLVIHPAAEYRQRLEKLTRGGIP